MLARRKSPEGGTSRDESEAVTAGKGANFGEGREAFRATPTVRGAIQEVPRFERRPTALRYGTAIILPIVALVMTLALEPYLQRVVFIFFWPAVVGAAVIGGLGPALLASLLSVALADYYLIAPLHSFSPGDPTELAPSLPLLPTPPRATPATPLR